jgi:hypothetical protein
MPRSSAKDRGEYRQAARAFAQAVIRSVELIVQPDAQSMLVMTLGYAPIIVGEASSGARIEGESKNAGTITDYVWRVSRSTKCSSRPAQGSSRTHPKL